MSKVILSIFAGRKCYIEILTYYLDLLLLKKLVDEVHFFDFIKNNGDREYIQELCEKKEGYILIPKIKTTQNPPWPMFYYYYGQNINDDDILIKCDDDVVYIDVDNFHTYIESVKEDKFYYPNIVNNDVCGCLQTLYGVHDLFYDVNSHSVDNPVKELVTGDIPPYDWSDIHTKPERAVYRNDPIKQFEGRKNGGFEWPMADWCKNFEVALKIHNQFCDNPEKFHFKNKELIQYNSRISINMFACKGNVVKKYFGICGKHGKRDEDYISALSGVGNIINLNTTIVHFSFNPQNSKRLQSRILHRYKELALKITSEKTRK